MSRIDCSANSQFDHTFQPILTSVFRLHNLCSSVMVNTHVSWLKISGQPQHHILPLILPASLHRTNWAYPVYPKRVSLVFILQLLLQQGAEFDYIPMQGRPATSPLWDFSCSNLNQTLAFPALIPWALLPSSTKLSKMIDLNYSTTLWNNY